MLAFDRMYTAACPHATWRVLVHDRDAAAADRLVMQCPAGHDVELTSIEPRPS